MGGFWVVAVCPARLVLVLTNLQLLGSKNLGFGTEEKERGK